eukprot:gene33567-43381_t
MPLEHRIISSSFHCLADETKTIQLRQSNSNEIIEDKTFASIVGCMRQLSTLAEYSNGLFIELVQLAGKTNERIESLRRRSQTFSETLIAPEVAYTNKRSSMIENSRKFGFHDVMSHENLPMPLKERYTMSYMRKVPHIEELHIFKSHLGTTDVSIMYNQRYSHPGYFLQHWCMAQEASGMPASRKFFSDWTRVARIMLYLKKMSEEQQVVVAADSDDEVDVLDPSLYGVPRIVEFDKSSQKNLVFLSPTVLISVEEINAIIQKRLIHLNNGSSESLPIEHVKLPVDTAAGVQHGEARAGETEFQRVYNRMRAPILPDDATQQRLTPDVPAETEAETSFSGSIWKLLRFLPGLHKRGVGGAGGQGSGSGSGGGGGGGGENDTGAHKNRVLTSYSTELEDLSKFYAATNLEEFSATECQVYPSEHFRNGPNDEIQPSSSFEVSVEWRIVRGVHRDELLAPYLPSYTCNTTTTTTTTTTTDGNSSNSAMSSCHTSNDHDADSDHRAISIMKIAVGVTNNLKPLPVSQVYMILERAWQLDNEESDSDS